MKIFDLPLILDAIQQELEAGFEPDAAKVALLIQDGPKAIESWVDMIDMAQAESDLLATRIKELQERKKARETTVERMKNVLSNILTTSFEGKVKTAEVTCWVQTVTSPEFSDPSSDSSYWVQQPAKLDKRKMIADYREGTLPKEISVSVSETNSLRVRR